MPQAMAMQTGRVSTQAMTILPAMPQRTAESRFVAPTPRMAVGHNMGRAYRHTEVACRDDNGRRGGFRSETVNGFELQHLDAQGLDDLPSAEERAEAHGQGADEDDPLRHIEGLDHAAAHKAPW